MPTYDYRCEADQQVHEVQHPMAVSVRTWAELCEVAGIDVGEINPDTPVTRLIRGAGVVRSTALKNPDMPPCMSGGGCSGGACGL